jgi:methylthioribose-1-phosphate isomerase
MITMMSKEQFDTTEHLQQDLSVEQQKAIEEVKKLNNKESALKRAETYATVMDGYCLEAIIGLIPELGDLGVGAINFVVYMKLASDLDASVWDRLKII